jgi:hypothetical protein
MEIRASSFEFKGSGQSVNWRRSWQLAKEFRSSQSKPSGTNPPALAEERSNATLTADGSLSEMTRVTVLFAPKALI